MAVILGPELDNPTATYTYLCGDCGETMTVTIPAMTVHRIVQVGQKRRRTTNLSRLDPHTVLRIDQLNRDVLIKFSDRTTAWEPLDWYLSTTEPVPSEPHL